jgi:hypothetical protein
MRESSDTETDEFVFDGDPGTEGASGGGVPDLLGGMDALPNSRREFMGDAAKVGAGAVAFGVAGSGTAAAAHGDQPYSDSEYEDNNPEGYGALTDVQIVKFALLLERLEATFYTEAVGDAPVGQGGGGFGGIAGINFNADTIADILDNDGGGRLGELGIEISSSGLQFAAEPQIRNSLFEYFQIIRDHEQNHVAALEGVLEEVGADPSFASGFEFEFPYSSADQFIDVARALEDTGAGAYTAAAPAIDIEEYLASAAQIALIEGRHASFLRVLTDTGSDVPFFGADMPLQPKLSVSEVYNRAAPFIVGAEPVPEGDNAAVGDALFEDGYAPDRT